MKEEEEEEEEETRKEGGRMVRTAVRKENKNPTLRMRGISLNKYFIIFGNWAFYKSHV